MEKIPSSRLTTINFHLLVLVTSYLEPKSLLYLSQTSKEVRKRICNSEFWRLYFSFRAIKLPNLKPVDSRAVELYSKVNTLMHAKKSFKLDMIGLEASSTDYNQSIHSLLHHNSNDFWSSLGSDTTEAQEYLLFSFKDISFVKQIQIEFFNAGGDFGHDVDYYFARDIVILLGVNEDEWFYQSKPFAVNNKPVCLIEIEKTFGFARFIKIILNGKMGLQSIDNKYYIAIENVKVSGFPIKINDPASNNDATLILQSMCNAYNIPLPEEELMHKNPNYYLEKLRYQFHVCDLPTVVAKYQELMKAGADSSAKWDLLQKNKPLLNSGEIFDFLLENDKPFARDYFERVSDVQKRDYLTEHEAYFAAMACIDVEGIRAGPVDRDGAMKLLRFDCLIRFGYVTVTKRLIGKLCDKINPDNKDAKKWMLERLAYTDNEDDEYTHSTNSLIGVMMAMIIVMSKYTPKTDAQKETQKDTKKDAMKEEK